MGKGKTWIGNELDEAMLKKLRALNELAAERGQKLSQMALSWVLRGGKVTTVLVGGSIHDERQRRFPVLYHASGRSPS